LGTFVEITACGCEVEKLHQAIGLAFERMQWVQHLMSVYEEDSEVSRLNRQAYFEPVCVSSWTWQVLQEAQNIAAHSKGSFSIAARPLREQGLDPEAFAYQNVTLSPQNFVRFLHPDTQIDLGGIAKGFAVDQAVLVLLEQGVESGLVNAGGDLRSFGERSFLIQVRHPQVTSATLMTIALENESLANSGRYFEGSYVNLHQDGTQEQIQAAGVRSKTCMRADALTKVLMNEGKGAAVILDRFDSAGYLIHAAEQSTYAIWTYDQPIL